MNNPPQRRRWPVGLTALRERNYVLYVVGQFTSQLGNWIELTAVSWILYEMTNSPVLLGLSGLFRATPVILFALFGGAIADRVPRRFLLLLTESTMLIASLTMGLLAASDQLLFWHLYLLNLVSGTLSAFSVPARHALFAGLVPRSSMQSAVTLNAVAVRSGGFIGPSIAGFALAFGGYSLPFLLNAASFLGMLAALLAMRLPPVKEGAKAPNSTLWSGMTEGLAFVWRNPLLKVALGLEVISGLFGHNTALITILARDVLGAGPEGLGFLLSALGAGGLVGMGLMVAFQVERHGRLILTVGALYALLLAAFGVSRWLGLSAILLFALGAADGVWAVTRNTMAQLLVSDALRGRVMSVVVLATRGSSQIGRLQSGALVGLMGGPAAVVVGAAVIGAAILASRRVPLPSYIGKPAAPNSDDDAAA
ncbi:MAG: MFS transporter [Burkholderiales bacterium]|nr:MFS transporter [Burkholderiales bacterium]